MGLLREDNNYNDKEKKQAAYALNMCTVSVSQIIDYEDLNILEQEYEAILNNINLENIPKDEALLKILKQLLDTITFFRIQEGDKKMIEREYQHKMKNAIWTAIPNFGLIVAGGNPITMAISLASQVGIGYMNYRRNKNEYELENEKQSWQLQKTAIEQFNGLRRELFDTAWRLADVYKFPDKYRLTEKQIKQYNEILIDEDHIRKYERLESIKENFEAYPPFWYFIGSAANFISENKELNISADTRAAYKNKALEYFEHFEECNKYDLLREDQIAASCAMEHIDILMLQDKPDKNKIKSLLEDAINYSGKANDILELCAITYLRLNDSENAEKLLRILVNEDYNKVINGQLLSSIYVKNRNKSDYELLKTRVDGAYLYPMPTADNSNLKSLNEEFGKKLKNVLKTKYQITFDALLQKYSVEWNKLTSKFDLEAESYEDSFFYDTPKANALRRDTARLILSDEMKRANYANRLIGSNYELKILEILNNIFNGLFKINIFNNAQLIDEVIGEITYQIENKKDGFNMLQESMSAGSFNIENYNYAQSLSLKSVVGRTFRALKRYAFGFIDNLDVDEVTSMEANLRTFCISQNLPEPEIKVNNSVDEEFGHSGEIFGPELFGRTAILARQNMKFISTMCDFVKEKFEEIKLKNDELSVYFLGDTGFDAYFNSSTFVENPGIRAHAIAVFKSNGKCKTDLIFTTQGIVTLAKGYIKNLTPYDEVTLEKESIITREGYAFKTTSMDVMMLYNVIKQLGQKFIDNIEDKIDYASGVLTSSDLAQWFKSHKEAMKDNVVRIIAIPNSDVLRHLGCNLNVDLDENKSVLQYFYDTNTSEVLGLRIVKFEQIDSSLQARLLENNGQLKVKI